MNNAMDKKNFVLVPGAWLGAWVWNKITDPLRKEGVGVYPITLSGMGDRAHLARKEYGIDIAVQDVINVIDYENLNNVVLVGHSFAGKVVAAVQDSIPERIGLMLFVDAFRPEKVRTPQGGIESWPKEDVDDLVEEVRNSGEEWKLPLTMDVLDNIGKDVVGDNREWLLSRITPWPLKLIWDPIKLSDNYDVCKKGYIFCTEGGDDVQRIIKEGVDGEYRIIESGHWPMLTKPAELVKAMLELSN